MGRAYAWGFVEKQLNMEVTSGRRPEGSEQRNFEPMRKQVGTSQHCEHHRCHGEGCDRNQGVVLRSEFADNLPPVKGDRVQLQQVILNLLRNASDAMDRVEDRPRELVLRTERDAGDQVRLTVKDVGVGFTREVGDKLFEAFHTTKKDGMGIGLSVSRSIIEAHHGHLWATSNDGPGATFSTLPTTLQTLSTTTLPHIPFTYSTVSSASE
jgi:signal transduction histidine kinase